MLKALRTLVVVSIVVLAGVVQNVGPAQAVVGGTPRARADFPYFVEVSDQIYGFCGGTLIEAGWVLTAAHCLRVDPIEVSSQGGPSDVAVVYFNPLSDAPGHDLALLQLADNHSAGVPPIQVGAPWNPELYAAGSAATIMGVGPPSNGFAVADVRVDTAAYMQALYSSWNSDLQIGAGSPAHTTCNGANDTPQSSDDGGPLVVNSSSGQPVQVGTADANACLDAGSFARLDGPQLAWIASIVPSIMNRWGPCTDVNGAPGHSEADYTTSYLAGYRPDGPYFWRIWCATNLDFSLTTNPSSATVAAGAATATTVTVVPIRGTGTVNLTAQATPPASLVGFSRPSVSTGGTSAMTLQTTIATPAGTYKTQIVGTALTLTTQGTVTRSATYTVNVTSTGTPGCTGAALSPRPVPIPDNGTPISSTITFPNCPGTGTTASVQVFITHPRRGDLVIDLIAPDGSAHRVKDADPSDTAPNINQIFTVSLKGVTQKLGPQSWALRVTDVAAGASGSLVGWAAVL